MLKKKTQSHSVREFFLLPILLIVFQISLTFASYNFISKISMDLDTYNSSIPRSSVLKPINLKYYDSKYSKNFEIEFQFQANAPTGNLFQTDNEGSGIRIELVPSPILSEFNFLIQYRAWDGERYLITTNELKLNRKYLLNLTVDVDNRVKLMINNQLILEEKISKQDIRYQRFILGAGLSGSRVFNGEITDAKINLDVYSRKSLIPIKLFVFSPLVILILYMGRKLISSTRTRQKSVIISDAVAILTLVSLLLKFNFQRDFADFFGDDFLMIWPIRGSDPLTIFTESIGPQYRPLTELLLLSRFELHGLNLSSRETGSKFLAAFLLIYLYWFLREKVRLSTVLASLSCLVYTTSIQFFGSALWWASVGTQHLLSQFLTIFLFSSIIDYFRKNCSQNSFYIVIFRALLLALSSEIFIPLFILIPFLILYFGKLKGRNILIKDKKKYIKTNSTIKFSFYAKAFVFPHVVTLLLFYIVRKYVVELNTVVAASSAKNYDFKSVDLLSTFSQFFEYFSSFSGNIFGIHFYDYGATGFRLMSFSEYGYGLQVFTIFQLLLLSFVFVKSVREWWSWRIRDLDREQGLNLSLLVTLVVSLLIPSMVPDYQQIRWVQLSYLLFLVLLLGVRESATGRRRIDIWLGIFFASQLVANLLLIHFNFGVSILR